MVGYAVSAGVGVAVEDLAWAPGSHWCHSVFQGRLSGLAADCGVPVVKVGASGTSRACPFCGGELSDSGGCRRLRCGSCGRVLERDYCVAARNVGVRALGFSLGSLSCFSYVPVKLGSKAVRHARVCRARVTAIDSRDGHAALDDALAPRAIPDDNGRPKGKQWFSKLLASTAEKGMLSQGMPII